MPFLFKVYFPSLTTVQENEDEMKAGEAESFMGQVTVSPTGNIGIGTTSSRGKLDVGDGFLQHRKYPYGFSDN